MSRRHHRRSGEVQDFGWKGIGAGRGKCAMYFHNPHVNQGSATIVLHGVNITSNSRTFEISTDGDNWITWGTISGNGSLSYNLPSGNRLYIRNNSQAPTTLSIGDSGTMRYYNFEVSSEYGIILGGDIRSLLCRNYNAASWAGWSMTANTFYSLFATDNHSQNRITLAQWSNGIYYSSTRNNIRFDLIPYETSVAAYCYSHMFSGIFCVISPEPRCKPSGGETDINLETGALVLPKTHSPYCCEYMFENASLQFGDAAGVSTADLSGCETGYFKGTDCYRIITMPSGTKTADYSMRYMFAGSDCVYSPIDDSFYGFRSGYANNTETSSHLASYCYQYMFYGCTQLRQAPTLWHGNALASGCYQSMFENCTSLVYPPELGATNLATACYYAMFKGCTNLEQAPELPALTLKGNCYREMFSGCIKLKYVDAKFTTTPGNSYTYNWLYNVYNYNLAKPNMGGVFVKNPSATWTTTGVSAAPTNYQWKIINHDGLVFYSDDGTTGWKMSLESITSDTIRTVQYSIDGVNWYNYNTGSHPDVTATNGYVLWKSNITQSYGSASSYNRFSFSNIKNLQIFCFGKMSSMTNGSVTAASYQFKAMFELADMLLTAPKLDMTNINPYCFYNMFLSCSLLEYAPYIPEFTFSTNSTGEGSFARMFYSCSALTYYPIIKNYSLEWAPNIAQEMFHSCESLGFASPFMSASYYGYKMGNVDASSFNSCFANCGQLRTPPNLNFYGSANSAFYHMFDKCANLVVAPSIITNTASTSGNMMTGMFSACGSLNRITTYFNTTPAAGWTGAWVNGVNAIGIFNKSGNWSVTPGNDTVPSGWTITQRTRPNLNVPDW